MMWGLPRKITGGSEVVQQLAEKPDTTITHLVTLAVRLQPAPVQSTHRSSRKTAHRRFPGQYGLEASSDRLAAAFKPRRASLPG